MKQEFLYAPPQCAVEAMRAAELLCTSMIENTPPEGGTESITYEDLVI